VMGNWNDLCEINCCAFGYPQLSTHAAIFERTNGTGGGVEDELIVSLVTLTIQTLEIRTTSVPSATLDLRFASKDWGGNTLTVAGDLTVNGGNGDVALRVQDSATIDVGGNQVVLTGGTNHTVTVIVTDSGAIKAHD